MLKSKTFRALISVSAMGRSEVETYLINLYKIIYVIVMKYVDYEKYVINYQC